MFAVEYGRRHYGAERRLAEAANPYTVVDLLAILPTLAVVVLPVPTGAMNAGLLRAVRVVLVLRFYRSTRDAECFFGPVSDDALRVVKLLLPVLVIFSVSAGLYDSVEVEATPGIGTFGDASCYVVVTLRTVGFGDIGPVTDAAGG